MVGTFADLAISYPEPDEGWTASVAADNITYRYDGTDWVPIMGSLSPLATENNNGLLSSTDFTKLGTIESGAQQDQNAVEVPYDNEESTLVSTNVQVAIDELDSKKLNANALNATLVLFATDAASDLANHFKLVSSVEDADYNTTAVNIPTPSITGTDQNVSNLISEPGLITGNPGVITISTIGQIRKISGNTQQNARFRYRVFKRDAADNEVELAVSDATLVVQSATYEEFFAFALLNNGQFAATDRIVVRYFADVDGNDGAIYQFQFGGTNPVRTLLPVPVQVLVAASEATNTIVNAQAFDTVLSPSDTTVQAALNTLDDHLHDNDYYQQDVLNPLIDFGFGGGPQANFNTFAPLDQRYGNVNQVFENSFRLATSEFNNLWQQGAFSKFGSPQNILDVANFLDNRIDESDPGIDFPSGTDTLAAAS